MVEHSCVRTFVGIDAHSRHCTLFACKRSGKMAHKDQVSTDPRELKDFFKELTRPVWVMVESCAMAVLVRDALKDVVDRVIVSETRENRLIAGSEDKDDWRDAERLAMLLRLKQYKEVYLPGREGVELRDLVWLYDRSTKDLVRAKNRLKSTFRRAGVHVDGDGVYDKRRREEWLLKVKRPSTRYIADTLYRAVDDARGRHDEVGRRIAKTLSGRKFYRILKSIPGVGEVTAAIIVAVVDDPSRFEDTRKLWKYAGLSISRQSSAGGKAKEGGSRSGNRLLKYAVMVAAQNAVRGDNRFAVHYEEMIKAGKRPAMALKTIARGILSAAMTMAAKVRSYRDDA